MCNCIFIKLSKFGFMLIKVDTTCNVGQAGVGSGKCTTDGEAYWMLLGLHFSMWCRSYIGCHGHGHIYQG